MKRKFSTKKVKANKVYCEYISKKNHLHMNATKWTSLSNFCSVNKHYNNNFLKYLHEKEKISLDSTDKGLYI